MINRSIAGRKITGPLFKRVLKANHIPPSVFAFKAQIELVQIKQTLESTHPVPKKYIDKLEQLFNVTEQKL